MIELGRSVRGAISLIWVDPFITPGAALKASFSVVPLAAKELRKFGRRKEVRNLFKATRKTIESDYRVPGPKRSEVIKKVKGLQVDPTMGGCLKALLAGDLSVEPQMEARARELLDVGVPAETQAVVEAFVEAVRVNVIPSKADDRAAIATVSRQQDELFTETQRQSKEITRGVKSSQRSVLHEIRTERGDATAFVLITGGPSFARETPKLLRELGERNASVAEEVAGRLAAGSGTALSAWADESTPRLATIGAATCALVGRLLMSEERYRAAERIFLLAADQDDEDKARQLVRASNAARAADRIPEAESHLVGAAAIDAQHPAVLIAQVNADEVQAQEALDRLDAVMPVTDGDRHNLALARAKAFLTAGALEDADDSLIGLEGSEFDGPAVLELRAIWRLTRGQTEAEAGRPAAPDLDQALDEFLALRTEFVELKRYDVSGHMLARAIESRIVSRSLDAAGELLESATPEERSGDARSRLARLALLSGRPSDALKMAREGTGGDEDRLTEAEVMALSADAAERAQAITSLDALLQSDESYIADAAALARAVACLDQSSPAEWSEVAEGVLAKRSPEIAVVLHARSYLARAEFGKAEELLLPLADDPKALDALVDSAAMKQDFPLALKRAESRVRIDESVDARFQHARLLRLTDQPTEALAEMSDVARTTEPFLPSERARAFREALLAAQALSRFAETIALATDAIAVDSNDSQLFWARAAARYHLSQHATALEELDEAQIEARTLDEAELLSRILHRAAPPDEAVRRNLELAERFGHPETLDAIVIIGAQRAPNLPPELEQQVRDTFASFPDRFPDSNFIRQVDAPQNAAELKAMLEQMAPDAGRAASVESEIRAGSTVTAVLADSVGRSMGELWASLLALPLGYGDPNLDELERGDAREAITSAAVFDPTSIAVICRLEPGTRDQILSALPGSVIAQATLADADRTGSPDSDPRNAVASIARDIATGEPMVLEANAEESQQRFDRQSMHLQVARGLTPEPDALPGSDDPIERALNGNDETENSPVSPALRTLAATVSVARRTRMPVYSDDRRVRIMMRTEGIPSFGTAALIQALSEHNGSDSSALEEARISLLEAGAVGLRPSGADLIELAKRCGWELTQGFSHVLADPTYWTHDIVATFRSIDALLRATYAEDRSQLEAWVIRCLHASLKADPAARLDIRSVGVLAAAWGWLRSETVVDPSYLQAVVSATRIAPHRLGISARTDPVMEALQRHAAAMSPMPPASRLVLILRAVGQLKLNDQYLALQVLGLI